nr:MAG TPA: putative replisome organizer protein [Caudoviricetes sp.]
MKGRCIVDSKCSFVLYTEYLEHIALLTMEQRGLLFTAILTYVAGYDPPVMDGTTQMAFSFIRSRLDRDGAAYADKIKKRSDAGKQGGRPKANESNEKQKKAKKANAFSEKQTKANESNEKQKNPDNVPVPVSVNDNNKKTLCKSADADALFERLWSLYPLKRGKAQVSKANKMHLLDIGFDEFQRAIDRYKADLDNETWRKPQNGSTFFNSGYIDYLDANYVPCEQKKEHKKNSFTDFQGQRKYDYDALEKQLLENGGT